MFLFKERHTNCPTNVCPHLCTEHNFKVKRLSKNDRQSGDEEYVDTVSKGVISGSLTPPTPSIIASCELLTKNI